jgi:hypothetical protein
MGTVKERFRCHLFRTSFDVTNINTPNQIQGFKQYCCFRVLFTDYLISVRTNEFSLWCITSWILKILYSFSSRIHRTFWILDFLLLSCDKSGRQLLRLVRQQVILDHSTVGHFSGCLRNFIPEDENRSSFQQAVFFYYEMVDKVGQLSNAKFVALFLVCARR